jgi:hypothetical protein
VIRKSWALFIAISVERAVAGRDRNQAEHELRRIAMSQAEIEREAAGSQGSS